MGGRYVGSQVVRFIFALFNLYVSLWKAWSAPVEPLRAARVYDQEREDDDWEFPAAPKQENRVPSTALMRMFNPDFEWAEYSKSIEYAQFVNAAEEGRL